jgi:hypothetical protein
VWEKVDKAWEQKKLKVWKMPEKPHRTHTSAARGDGQIYKNKTFHRTKMQLAIPFE